MSSVQHLREFISERLTAAAEEIFIEFEKTIVQYEEKIDRQHKLLDISWKQRKNFRTANLPLQHDCKEEEVLTDSHLDQEEPEPPQTEEDQVDVHTSREGEQLFLKNETGMITQCMSEQEEMDTDFQNTSIHYKEEADHQTRLLNIKIIPQISLHRVDISHQHICKEEEEDLVNQQQRNCSMDQDEPETPQIKEEPEQLSINQEGDPFVLKQETEPFIVTPKSEGSDLVEPEPNNQLFPHNSLLAELHVQEANRDVFSGFSVDTDHMMDITDRSHTNNMGSSPRTEGYHKNDQSENSVKSDFCGKASKKKSPLEKSVHTSEKSHSCNVCGKCFTRGKKLAAHMRTHTDEKPYSCQTCEKGLSYRGDLTAHGRIPAGKGGERKLNPAGIVPTSRFTNISAAELDKLEKSKNEVNTVRQTVWAINCFQTWLQAKSVALDFQSVEKRELNQILREFYGSVRTTKGEFYGISSYLGLRAGLNRYINEPPISRSWNLLIDSEFIQANNVFKGVIKQIRRAGRDRKTHHPPITLEDQLILMHSAALQPDNPRGLLNKVWYDLQLHFGRRGREGNRALKPDSFLLKTSENGAKYFTLSFNEETKNDKDPLERDREKGRGVMFEEPGNYLCPVASLLKYFSKIPPDGKALYLQPKRSVAPTDVWYSAAPLGVNTLAQMLPNMCKEAGTKIIYSNHSLRATAIKKLSDSGLPARDIVAVSGNRSESSLQSCSKPSVDIRKRCSSALSDQTESAVVPAKQQPASPDADFTGCTISENVQIDRNTK